MKTVIIVRLYFDHFNILWDYIQKWINGKIKMMMMTIMHNRAELSSNES